MGKKSFKGRIVNKIKREQSYLIKVEDPFMLNQVRPSLSRAGIRVTNPAHYFPILEQIDPKTWVVTALGSRGLLYHAYLGKKLSLSIT